MLWVTFSCSAIIISFAAVTVICYTLSELVDTISVNLLCSVRVNCCVTFAYTAIIWSRCCCVCHLLYHVRTNCYCKCQVSSQLIAIFVVTCYIMSYLVAVCCHKKVSVTSVYSDISEHNAVETITSCAMSELTAAAAAITCCAVSHQIGILDVTSYVIWELTGIINWYYHLLAVSYQSIMLV